MTVYKNNLFCIKKLQKQAYEKGIGPQSYAFSNKLWLNRNYIKTKQNQNLKVKFFKMFQVLYSMKKQIYKLELFKK